MTTQKLTCGICSGKIGLRPDGTFKRHALHEGGGAALCPNSGKMTTQAQHTPGPWEIAGDNLGCKNITAPNENPGWNDICSTVGKDDEEEDLANARLIAVAPDLLAACQAMADAYTIGHAAMDKVCEELVFPAIARAEGKE